MVGSEDDLFEDLDLDEDAFAALAAEENKHFTQPAARETSQYLHPPPLKRQRTTQGWIARVPSEGDDYEDLPDISVNDDGSYGLNTVPETAAGSRPTIRNKTIPTQAHNYTNAAPMPARPLHIAITGAGSSNGVLGGSGVTPINNQTVNTTAFGGGYHPRTFQPPRRTDNSSNEFLSQRNSSALQSQVGAPIRRANPYALHNRTPNTALKNTAANSFTGNNSGTSEIAALRAQIEQLARENEQAKSALKDAQNIRYAKEGENTHLRKEIEKSNQEHNNALNKLKAAKEAAEAQRLQMERLHKEELERLRTQVAFKQLEASSRKPPPSVRRVSRVGLDAVPPTPVRMPSQMRTWKQPAPPGSATPRSPRKSPRKSTLPSAPLITKRNDGALPGFVNAFSTSSPVTRLGKKRETSMAPESSHRPTHETSSLDWGAAPDTPTRPRIALGTGASQQFSTRGPPLSPPSSPPSRRGSSPDLGLDMDVGSALRMASDVPEEDEVSGEDNVDESMEIIWRDELQRLLFAHIAPWAGTLTLQMLFGTTLSKTVSSELRAKYSSACSTILHIVSTPAAGELLVTASEELAGACVILLHGLMIDQQDMALAALLNLISSLSLSLPFFLPALSSDSITPGVVDHIKTIIQTRFLQIPQVIATDGQPGSYSHVNHNWLLEETLSLLEALNWDPPDQMLDCLSRLVRMPDIWSKLLDAERPPWLIYRAARCGALLASRPALGKEILLAETDGTELLIAKAFGSILAELSIGELKHDKMHVAIMTFASTLANSPFSSDMGMQPDAFAPLLPALVIFLYRLSADVWEDEPSLIASASLASSTIRTMHQALFLLHHLVLVNSDGGATSRHIFTSALSNPRRIRVLNGVHHAFHVALGRLSYADPPDWLAHDDRVDFGAAQELARDLLDLIVEGPEGDAVYGVYQGEEEDDDTETEPDDDEAQARML